MKILLTTLDGSFYPVEVSADIELINLKALCEQETNISASKMSISHFGKLLADDSRTLESYSIKENDILMVQQMITNVSQIDFSSITVPQNRPASSVSTSRAQASESNAANTMRQMLMSDPVKFEVIRQRFPDLADAIQKNDSVRMMQLMSQMSSGLSGENLSQPAAGLSSNYFDMEAQKRIAENIRLQNVQQNMESALEYMPEAFGNVVMLYINCQVNGHDVKAFVDSGAQMTIMSAACAERCGIMRLVDTRWAGIAKGVGTQKIVGRVHLAQIQIEKSFLTTAFSILEEQAMDMLLGLDILKRHQCIIDLERNILVIKSAKIETKFLTENELPLSARPQYADDHSEEMPEVKVNPESKATPGTSSSKQSTASSSSQHSESVIESLVKLGFSRSDVIDALNTNGGDENRAKITLLAKSLQFPKK